MKRAGKTPGASSLNIASGHDLDQLANVWGLSRRSQESDGELRVRAQLAFMPTGEKRRLAVAWDKLHTKRQMTEGRIPSELKPWASLVVASKFDGGHVSTYELPEWMFALLFLWEERHLMPGVYFTKAIDWCRFHACEDVAVQVERASAVISALELGDIDAVAALVGP